MRGGRHWAIVRLVLGLLQMAGAGISLALLIETGINVRSLISVVVTGLLTSTSVLLFGSARSRSIGRQNGKKGQS
jgi:hypothetical protein